MTSLDATGDQLPIGTQPRDWEGISLVRGRMPERTLLDGLQDPGRSDGAENVLQAWAISRDMRNLDLLVNYVDRFNVALLRQRAGFVLE